MKPGTELIAGPQVGFRSRFHAQRLTMKIHWSRHFTIIAGVLGALVCYGVITHFVLGTGLVSGRGASLLATKMISANVGAIAAAAVVGAWPSDRNAPLFESLTTWAVATAILMIVAGPGPKTLQPTTASLPAAPDAVVQHVANR